LIVFRGQGYILVGQLASDRGDSIQLKGGLRGVRRDMAHSGVQGRGNKTVLMRGHYYLERGRGN